MVSGSDVPVIVHSLFRSGSTYIFDVFRRAGSGGSYYCYLEPLHEDLLRCAKEHAWLQNLNESKRTATELRHPPREKAYFEEYAPFAAEVGRPFRPEFPYDMYFMDSDASAPGLEQYFALLCSKATRRPVLQCCRSTGRLPWITNRFRAVNVFLWRSPYDQWRSYQVNTYFDATSLLILQSKSAPPVIQALRDQLDIPRITCNDPRIALRQYQELEADPDTRLTAFLGLWCYAMLEAGPRCDVTISMDLLSSSAAYRNTILESLAKLGIVDLTFDDCAIPRHERHPREMARFIRRADQVLRLFAEHGYNAAQLNHLDTLLNPATGVDAGATCPSTHGFSFHAVDQAAGKRKPRLVVAAPFPVYPAISGGERRIFYLYRSLLGRFEVTLLTISGPDKPPGTYVIQPGYREIRVAKSILQLTHEVELNNAASLSTEDIGMTSHIFDTPEFIDVLRDLAKSADFVCLSHPYLYPAVAAVWNGPIFYDAHNVELDLKRQMLPESPVRDVLLKVVEEVEKACCERSELVYCCSEDDRKRLSELYNTPLEKILIAPNGYAEAEIEFVSLGERGRLLETSNLPKIAVFIGSNHLPNVHALESIFRIADQLPEIQFIAAGSVCNAFPKGSGRSNVHLVGMISEEEKKGLLAIAAVAVNPMESGSGTNLKTIEFLAAGVPLVTTPFGARGLRLVDGVHCRVAEIEAFPAAIRELTNSANSQFVASMVQAGRAHAQVNFSWERIGRRLVQELTPFLGESDLGYSSSSPTANGVKFGRAAVQLDGEQSVGWDQCTSTGFGVNIIGHVSGNLGIGVTARNFVALLLEHNIPLKILDLDPGLGRGRADLSYARYEVASEAELTYPVTIFILPPETIALLAGSKASLFDRRRLLVGLSMWELPVVPKAWRSALESMDVLLAESEFIRYAFEFNLSGVFTLLAHHPLYLPDGIRGDRARFGLPADCLLFLNSFEPHSDPARKNPFAVLEAFKLAFPSERNVRFVFKINNAYVNGVLHPAAERIRGEAERDPRIILILEKMDYRTTLELYASCDVFVSLHRSEGLGLGLMEAMALGKPVIATAWSGNMSFMDHESACLVRYRLRPLNGTIRVYTPEFVGDDCVWAEPSIADAAAWMRQLFEDEKLRVEKGQRAQARMQAHQKLAQDAMFLRELKAIWEARRFMPHKHESLSGGLAQSAPRDEAYALWRSKQSLTEVHAQTFAERMMRKWKQRPTFRLVLMLQPGQDTQLADTIDSLASQLYPGWRLVVVAPFAAPDPAFNEVEQLGWVVAHSSEERARAVNALAAEGAGDWLWLLPGGARIEPHALLRWGDYIDLHPEWRIIYCDDDRILADGNFGDPWFKPDFNLDLLRSMDYVGPFLVRGDSLLEAGGYSELEGAETYDLLLRVLDRFGEASIGHVADVLLHLPGTGMLTWSAEAAMEAAREHLVRAGISGEVLPGYIPGTHRIVYRHSSTPLVSVIIPNRDKLEYLQPCVESLLEKTTYPNYEVLIVDNGSTDPDLLEYYRNLQQTQGERVRILAYDAPFNFSAMNNEAARQAGGEYLLLLNNDTQIVQGEWLERMVCHGQRPEVGIVGARLVYPETGRLQHAGVVLGLRGVAEHVFTGELGLTDPGYMNRALVDQNYSAVTAACMLVRRSLFEEVDGFDEQSFAVSFNDVDLCLKIRKRGYKVVWTPFATVVHHGSASQKAGGGDVVAQALKVQRFESEHRAMLAKWLPILANDPAYNRHLSLQPPGYEVETAIVIDWDPYFHDRPRLLGLPLSGGSGEYRVISPFRALSRAALAHGDVIQTEKYFESRLPMPVELERAKPDTLVLQAALGDPALQAMADYRQFNGDVMLVFALDDLVTQMPPENPFFRNAPRDVRPRLRKALSLCDRVVVSTEPIAELCRAMHGDVRVIPNRLEKAIWGGLSSRRRRGTRARVGWAGAQQHAGDLALIVEVVKATAQEVDWVFFGMCPEALRPFVREYHDFVVSFYDYPAKLASLDLDLAVAPLAINPFNEAKSNLRLLEYGILGWPVVCTDIYPYRDAPVKRVPNTPEAWIEAIRERVYDLDAAEREGERLRQWVLQHYILEDHLDEWLQALTR